MKFIAVGLLNTVFGYAIFAVLILWGRNYETAALISTLVGASFNYYTSGLLVFDHFGLSALPRFILAYFSIFGLNILLLRWMAGLGLTALQAQALIVPALAAISYLVLSNFVFAGREH